MTELLSHYMEITPTEVILSQMDSFLITPSM